MLGVGVLLLLLGAVDSAQSAAPCVPAWQPVWPPGAQDRSTGRVFARDSRGMTWVGGNFGLFRLDGQSVTAWYPQPEQEDGLPGPQVEALWVDGDDNLWIGTAAGLAVRDARSGRIDRVALTEASATQPEVYVLYAHGEYLLAGTHQGLAVLRLSDRAVVREAGADGEWSTRVYGMAAVGDRVYGAGPKGLRIADRRRAYAVDEKATEALPSPFRDAFLEIITGPDGLLYAGTRSGVLAFSPDAPAQARRLAPDTVPGFPDGAIFALTFDHRGQLWVGGERGLSRWAPGASEAMPCSLSTGAERAGSTGIAYLWSGAPGELWVGMASTDDSVRARLDSPGVERLLLVDPRSTPGLEGELRFATILADGRLWVTTVEGVFREVTPGTRRFAPWREETFAGKPVYALAQDADGDVWIGGPLGLYVEDGERLRRVTWWANAGPPRPGAPPIFTLLVQGGRVWVAGAAGLAEVDAGRNEVVTLYSGNDTVLAPEGAQTVFTPNIRPWTVFAHESGRIYAAGEAGVLSIDPARRTFFAATQFAEQERRYPGSAAVAVGGLGEEIYVGDESGVFTTDATLSAWQRLSVAYPRPSRASRGIAVDPSRGQVWFSTVGGVLAYSPRAAEHWRFYDRLTGLHANTFSEGVINLASNGRLVLGGEGGISIIDPRLIRAEAVAAPQLLELSIDDVPQSLPDGGQAVLAAGQRRLGLRYGSPDLWIGPDMRLEYQLQGYDREPRAQALAQSVTYEGLRPGDYMLQVRLASAQRGVSPWRSLALHVGRAWWQTPWAAAAAILAVALLLMAAVRLRVRQLTASAQLVADERDRIARELHDRHLQELIGALMIGRRLRGTLEEPLREQSAQMVALLERSSESARATIRMLAPPGDTHSFAQQVRFHAECAARAFSRPVTVVEEGAAWRMTEQQRRHAVRIVNEAVINALKHAQGNQVTVSVRWTRPRLVTTVDDDGAGMTPPRGAQAREDGSGLGLRNMEQLARAIGAVLTIDARAPRGTRVTLTMKRPPLWSQSRWQAPPPDMTG